ncbi:MAG: mechanosensitive ion channel [Lachnospiraceae bacterium]|jgi:small conductance mechanosensitive channel|nr:mechanosensitive ion channel [Lachnospiraceae bacterium]
MDNYLLEELLNIDDKITESELGLLGQFLKELPEKALNLGIRVVLAILALLLGLQIIRVIRKIVERALARTDADKGVSQFLDSLIKIGLTAFLLLMIAVSFGLDAASVMAMLGSVGVAFALALQGSLSNCAGGVLILLLKPFVVGDYIIEGNKGQEGTVTEIQLFYTKLRTADDMIITLPNGSLANNNITNYSTVETRRMDAEVGVSYEADLKKAKEVLLSVLEEEGRVLSDKDRKVFVKELADSAVILGIRCWFLNEDYWDGRAAVLEKSKLALDDNSISIPYPQLDVHMEHRE